jgi:large subunit ribosomal protein L4
MATKTSTVKEPKVKAAKVEVTTETPKTVKKAVGKFEVTAFDLTGKEAGTLALPESIFGGGVSKELLKQAIRVYNSNRQSHWGNTKTRGEVQGSTRKIGPQKGGGRARHGSVMAPIFVGGGIALGPRTRHTVLDLPKKMRTAALLSALAQKHQAAEVSGIAGLDKATGKTKEMAVFAKSFGKKSVLIVEKDGNTNALRSVKNLGGISMVAASQLNAFEVIAHKAVLFTKDALEVLNARIEKSSKEESANA